MSPMCMLGGRILREAVPALEGHADDEAEEVRVSVEAEPS